MNEFIGTKGVWDIEGLEGNLFPSIVYRESRTTPVGSFYKSGCVDAHFTVNESGSGTLQECKANALLISKAPEMLKMLKRISALVMYFEEWELEKQQIDKLIKEATEL